MFDSRHRHLNIFSAWRTHEVAEQRLDAGSKSWESLQLEQKALEKNLTRALAIALVHDAQFAVRFAQVLDAQAGEGSSLAEAVTSSGCRVNIEIPSRCFEKPEGFELDPALVVPVVIAADSAEAGNYSVKEPDGNYYVDMIVGIGDHLVIIEAKRGNDSRWAQAQLRGYLRRIGVEENTKVICVKWQSLLHGAWELNDSHDARGGNGILGDFVEHLSTTARQLQWQGIGRKIEDLLRTRLSARDYLWRREVDSALECWVRELAAALGDVGASIEENILASRYCIRLEWGWAQEINFQYVLRDGRKLARREWLGDKHSADPVGVDVEITVGDTVGQIDRFRRAFPGRHPSDFAREWEKATYIGFKSAFGPGLEYLAISERLSRFVWDTPDLLRKYKIGKSDHPTAEPALELLHEWGQCVTSWKDFSANTKRTELVLTARVEFHRQFSLQVNGFPELAEVVDAIRRFRRGIAV